jgi:protein-tyrosine phosphatase
MTKVLFVCLGNICRSAMAQGILEHKIKEQYLAIEVDSAGTSSYHIGDAPDKRMQAKGLEYDIDISQQQARQFRVNDFEEFDYIFAMDSSNYNDIIALAKTEKDKQKVSLFLNQSTPNQNKSVPDPYYGGEQGFEDVYQMLDIACDAFIKKIEN